MHRIIRRHSHHILIGITSLIAAVTLGMGFLAFITYEGYESYEAKVHTLASNQPLTLSQMVKNNKQIPQPIPVVIPSPTPTPAIVPDDHIGPVTDGLAPVVTSFVTDQPVVFLTIDDGAHKTPDELQTMQDNDIKATLFLARAFITDNPGFFMDFAKAGYPIENHTLSHDTNMTKTMSYEQQRQEICGMADYEEQHYGRRPIFFRPPGGAYSNVMRRAAADCGMKAVVTWIAKANGGSMQYQIGDHLRPGDVVLMHFRPEFQQDLKAFMDAAKSQHLRTELLQDWL
jgi:peptidoglycan/xylan/chitin deacetylase (PgdA/CDA1 family)